MNVRKKKITFFVTTKSIGQFFKSIIEIAQIFGETKSHFCRLINKMLNI